MQKLVARGDSLKRQPVLYQILLKLNTNTLFKNKDDHLNQAVFHMMKNIIIESSKLDARFKVKDLQLIGSMYEETKILAPNEFDFFVVFDYDITSDRGISLESGCRPGFTKIRVNEIS